MISCLKNVRPGDILVYDSGVQWRVLGYNEYDDDNNIISVEAMENIGYYQKGQTNAWNIEDLSISLVRIEKQPVVKKENI